MIEHGQTERGIRTVSVICDGGCGRVLHAVGGAGLVRLERAVLLSGPHLCPACTPAPVPPANDGDLEALLHASVQIPHPDHG